jgi:hypothetical protein
VYSDVCWRGALAALPDLRPAQVYLAIRGYADAPTGEPRSLMSRSENPLGWLRACHNRRMCVSPIMIAQPATSGRPDAPEGCG